MKGESHRLIRVAAALTEERYQEGGFRVRKGGVKLE